MTARVMDNKGSPYRGTVLSPRGTQFTLVSSMFLWKRFYATGLGWCQINMPSLKDTVIFWHRRHIFYSYDGLVASTIQVYLKWSFDVLIGHF